MTQGAMVVAGLGALLFACLMVFQRSLYGSAVCLLAVVCQVAALLFLAGAPLFAFLQVLIYAGAVMVLIVVSVMASSPQAEASWSTLFLPRPLGWLVLIVPAATVAVVAVISFDTTAAGGTAEAAGRVGSVLFGSHAVATEAVTLLMFFAALALDRGRRAS
jgi:NADH-quinone oxidoreductase subunit J